MRHIPTLAIFVMLTSASSVFADDYSIGGNDELEKMTDSLRWQRLKRTLDKAIKTRQPVWLASSYTKAKNGNYFANEIKYLLSKGYKFNPNHKVLNPSPDPKDEKDEKTKKSGKSK